MPATGHTWIVLQRDASHAVRVDGLERVLVTVILDADTGYVYSVSADSDRARSLRDAVETALATPAAPLEARPPGQVQCAPGLAPMLTDVLGAVAPSPAIPVDEAQPADVYEDLFDSLIGMMAGRPQAQHGELPAPDDWTALIAGAERYRQAQPWTRWTIAGQLDLVVRIGGAATRYLAVVIGQQDTQRGLILYPGAVVPKTDVGEDGRPALPPLGTLLFYLDDPAEIPKEYVDKAIRYGWPADADVSPIVVVGGPEGPADLSRTGAHHMTVAIAALLAHDIDTSAVVTEGTVGLPDGSRAEYSVRSRAVSRLAR
jgi:hypothetical protein